MVHYGPMSSCRVDDDEIVIHDVVRKLLLN